MSLKLTSPSYSFVQLAEPENPSACAPQPALCLPVKTQFELAFQLIATVSGADKDWFEVEATADGVTTRQTIWGRICTECADLAGTEIGLANSFSYTGQWRRIVEDTTDVWVGQFKANVNGNLFTALQPGQCFNICFYRVTFDVEHPTTTTGLFTTLRACTNTCFNKIADDCYTAHFNYKCNENTFGFTYIDKLAEIDFVNAVRLPCYLRNLQLPTEEKSYVKSDGSKIKLYARIDEEYDLVVDFIPKQWHINLKVLLAHDVVTITNVNETGDVYWPIVCNEKYEINWLHYPYGNAPAKTKVQRAQALSLINSNCNP